MTIKIEHQNDAIIVEAPYHPDFPAAARKLGGCWNKPVWTFDVRDEDRVRELCMEIYGDDGRPQELVNLRVNIDGIVSYESQTSLYIAGREIVRIYGRDSGARLGKGVVVLKGSFSSGGSRKNPDVEHDPGTIVEIRDVPRTAAEAAARENPSNVLIIDSGDNEASLKHFTKRT